MFHVRVVLHIIKHGFLLHHHHVVYCKLVTKFVHFDELIFCLLAIIVFRVRYVSYVLDGYI